MSYDKLLLSDNLIHRIAGLAFSGIRFRKLEIINNALRYVNETAFTGLESTLAEVVLELDDTADAQFPHAALSTLLNLTALKVANYAGSRLPAAALTGLRTLRELRLVQGDLESLTMDDVLAQRSSLEILDISDNKLHDFPTDAIKSLTALRVLNVRANLIDHLAARSIVSSSLEQLDISQNALDRDGINSSAFDGVASTLRRLVMSQCHLKDRHVAAISRAAAVTELIVSFNFFTSVRLFLADMPNLERLDAQNNSVDVLTTVSLPSTRHLRALNLAYNPLGNIHLDAFVELRQLEDLKLDFARAATPLYDGSFMSQRSTLRNLSLRGVNLHGPQWSVIRAMQRLEMVSLSGCRLSNIPPFTFRYSGGRLHTLELAGNRISELTQRALVGLETSLVRLNLGSNRLTTIDRCTFYRFTKLDPKSLILSNNNLTCDCRLRWMYRWKNGSQFALFWNCDDADFQQCSDSEDDRPCEDFTVTTPTDGLRPPISVFVVNVTSTSFAVRWTVDSSALPATSDTDFRINCSCAESWLVVDKAVKEHRFEGLDGGTAYRVCVMLEYVEVDSGKWTNEVVSCLDVTTTTWLSDPAVMILVVVSIVLIVVVPSLSLIICLVTRRWRHRRLLRLAEHAQPKVTAGKTKRFMRQQRPLSNNRVDMLRFQSRSVETNLDTLQDDDADDRYRTLLALQLQLSRSLDNLYGQNAATSNSFINQPYSFHNKVEQEVYDEINDAEVDGCESPLTTETSI